MKKHYLSVLLVLFAFIGVYAQEKTSLIGEYVGSNTAITTTNKYFACKTYLFITQNGDTLSINKRIPVFYKYKKNGNVKSITIFDNGLFYLCHTQYCLEPGKKYKFFLTRTRVIDIEEYEDVYYRLNAEDDGEYFREIPKDTLFREKNLSFINYVDIDNKLYILNDITEVEL